MVNLDFTEKLLIKAILEDERYMAMISSAVDKKYFTSRIAGKIYENVQTHYSTYKELPTVDIIVNTLGSEDIQSDAADYFKSANSVDFNIPKQFDFLVDATDQWLRQRALQLAIMESADIASDKNTADYGKVRELFESALTKTLKIDLGLNYFEDLGSRLKRILTETDTRVKTYFPMLDDILNGGLTPYTLSVFVARIHGGKSLIMNNLICRQVLNGLTPVMFTLEMSEDAMAQRFDSILSKLDINRIYSTKKKDLIEKLTEIKNNGTRGNLFVKQYAPRSSSVNDFRSYLHELEMRKIRPSIIYADYINLMRPSYKTKNALHEDITQIAEELRALSFEYRCPVVSVTQINRGGMRMGIDELDFDSIAGSLGIGNTADFLAMLGTDYDSQVYQSEIHYKVQKNRIGGQVGTIGKLYLDDRSLKLYDESELELWMKDAAISNGGRGLKEPKKETKSEDSSRYSKRN